MLHAELLQAPRYTRAHAASHTPYMENCYVCVETTRVCHQPVHGGCCTLTRVHTQRRVLDAVTRVCTLVVSSATRVWKSVTGGVTRVNDSVTEG